MAKPKSKKSATKKPVPARGKAVAKGVKKSPVKPKVAAKKASPTPGAAKKAAKPAKAPKPVAKAAVPAKAGAKNGAKNGAKAKAGAKGINGSRGPLVRVPKGAEELKVRLGALSGKVAQIRNLRRSLQKNFFDIALLMREIELDRLFEVKGYGSFEAFVERELDLGKRLGLRMARVSETFVREAAEAAGLDRVIAAIDALHGTEEESSGSFNLAQRSAIPVHKQ
ncbi:MAG: hypothetical protein KC417_09785 [Myxococcales bacterium]|nr:hypothetical protein [Myxococcales bacterium]